MRHAEQEYMPPRPPHVANASELDRLRREVADAEAEIASPTHQAKSWVDRTRREQDVKRIRRQLEDAELHARQAMSSQRRKSEAARNLCLNGPGRPVTVFEALGSPSQPGDEIAWDDSGTLALNASSFARASGKVAANAAGVEYAELVPYWKS